VLRIFPLYYFVLICVFGYAFFNAVPQHAYFLDNQIFYWTYTQNLLYAFSGWPASSPLLNHFWSLAIEEQFYLFWPLVVLTFSRNGILAVCGLLIVLSIVLRILNPEQPFSFLFTFCRLDTLACGAAAAVLIREKVALLNRYALPVCLLSALAIILAVAFSQTTNPIHPTHVYVSYSVVSLFFASILVMCFDQGAVGRNLRAIFEYSLLRFFGKYSYGIYVYHWLVFIWLRGLDPQVPFIVMVAVTIAISMISYHYLEVRFLNLKSRFT
jgi:peptidoglycan/LPS O-acetylase OafA/YrhL